MAPNDPFAIRWTAHAVVRAETLGATRADVEEAILAGHVRRRRNPGDADWLLDAGRWTVAYNHPNEGDDGIALVVTVWRRA